VARFLDEPQHHLGVDEILRTAERNQTNLQWRPIPFTTRERGERHER
jgi:hypothetical protein